MYTPKQHQVSYQEFYGQQKYLPVLENVLIFCHGSIWDLIGIRTALPAAGTETLIGMTRPPQANWSLEGIVSTDCSSLKVDLFIT